MNLPAEMIGQFLLGKAEVPALVAWPKQQINGWILHWHPHLPVTEIRSWNGAQVGWLLGLAIDAGGHPLGSVWRLPFDGEAADAAGRFESELNSLGGRFAAIFLSPSGDRFYVDATASLSAVYRKDHPVLASSCNLIPQIGEMRQDLDLLQAFGIPQRAAYLPFGLTPFPGLARLLPNHYLDLREWSVKRHWPAAGGYEFTNDIERGVREIAAMIEAFIAGVAEFAPIQLTLTGGYDSRVLLACARSSLPSIQVISTQLPDIEARIDCAYGKRIASRLGVNYSQLAWKESSPAEIATWLYRTGGCVMDRIATCVRTDEQLDRARVTLLGLGGEVGHHRKVHSVYYWRPEEARAHPPSGEELIRRFHFPRLDIVLREASNWLNGLPSLDCLWERDLFFLEQRLGCWAGPTLYGAVQARFVTYPYNSRRLYEKMLSLPPAYRIGGQLPIDLIRLKLPELLEIPFNQPFGWLKFEYRIRRNLNKVRTKIGNAGARRIKSTLTRILQ